MNRRLASLSLMSNDHAAIGKRRYVSGLQASLRMLAADEPSTVLPVLSGFSPSVQRQDSDASRSVTNGFFDGVTP
jgi:hypothetical protein